MQTGELTSPPPSFPSFKQMTTTRNGVSSLTVTANILVKTSFPDTKSLQTYSQVAWSTCLPNSIMTATEGTPVVKGLLEKPMARKRHIATHHWKQYTLSLQSSAVSSTSILQNLIGHKSGHQKSHTSNSIINPHWSLTLITCNLSSA